MALYRIDITHDTAFNECIIQLTLPTLDADFASDLSNLQFVQDGTILEHKVDDIVTRVVRVKLLYLNNGTTTIYLRPGPDVGAGTLTSITYIEDFDSTPSNLVTVCANTDYTISNGLLRVNNNTVALGPFNDDFRRGHLVKSRFRIPSDYSGSYGQVVSVTSVPYGVYKVPDTNGAWFAIYGLSAYFTGAQGSTYTYVLPSFSWNVATWYRATVQVAGSQVITQLLDDSESTVLASETIDIPGGPFTYALNYITFGAYIDPTAYSCTYNAIDIEVDWVSYESDASITPNNVTFTQESSNVIFGVSIPIYDVEHIHRLPELSRAPMTRVSYDIIINSPVMINDYCVKITLPQLNNAFASDLSNLKFMQGATVLSHWVEDVTNRIVWVRVPTLNAGDNTIVLVPNDVSDSGSPTNVFDFYEDFNDPSLTGWTIYSDSYVVENSYIRMNLGVGWSPQLSVDVFDSYIVEGRIQYLTTDGTYSGQLSIKYDPANYKYTGSILYHRVSSTSKLETYYSLGSSNNWNGSYTTTTTVTDTSWHILGLAVINKTQIKYFLDGTEIHSIDTTGFVVPGSYINIGGWLTANKNPAEAIGDTAYDWIRVRKYTSPEPTVTSITDSLVSVVKQYPSKVITATQPMYLYELGIVADNTVVDGVIEVDLPTTFGDLWPSTFDYNRLQVWYNGHQLKHYVVDANTGVVRIQIPHVGAFVTRLLIVENVDSSITWSELSSASLTNINVAYVNRYEWTPYLFKYLTSDGAPPTTIYELYTAVFNKLQGLSHLTHISEIQTSTAHMKSPVCNIQSGNTHIDVRPVVESVSNIMTTYTHNTISTGQIMSKYIMSVDILNNIIVYYSGLSASITQLLRKAMSLFARLSIVHSSADAVFIGSGEPIIMSASSINFVVKDMSVYGALYANVITTKDIKVLTDTIVWFSDTTIGAIQQPVVQSAYVIVQNTLDSIGSVAKYILTHIVTAHRELRVFPTRSTVHRAAHEYVLNQMSVQSTKYRLNTLSNNVTQEIITLTTTLATSATLTSVNSIMQYVVSKIKQLHSLHQLLSTHHLFELFGQILSTVKYRSIQSSLINSIWFVDIAVGGSAFATTHKAQDQFVEALKSTVTQEQWLTTLLNSGIVQTQYINNLLIDTHLYNIIHSNAHNILRWYQLTYGHTMFTGKSTVQAIPTQIITGTFIYSGINNALYNNNLYIRLTGDVISSILYKTTITGVHTSSSLYYQWLTSTQVKMVQILSVILRTLVMDLPSLRSLVRDIALLRTKVID